MISKAEKKAYDERYRAEHRDLIRERARSYRARTLERRREYERDYWRERRQSDPTFRARRAELEALRRKTPKHRAWLESYRKTPAYAATQLAHVWSKYGITPDDYADLFVRQRGRCGICKALPSGGRPLAIDHCHASERVRGLLCDTCNLGLGHIERYLADRTATNAYLRGFP